MNAKWNAALEAVRLQLEHDPEGHSLQIGFKKIKMAHIKGLHTLHKPNADVKFEASQWKLKER